MKNDLLTIREKEILYKVLQLACELAVSLRQDIEEDPDSASNETVILLNNFQDKVDELNEALEEGQEGMI
jgi:hypothetical protein